MKKVTRTKESFLIKIYLLVYLFQRICDIKKYIVLFIEKEKKKTIKLQNKIEIV